MLILLYHRQYSERNANVWTAVLNSICLWLNWFEHKIHLTRTLSWLYKVNNMRWSISSLTTSIFTKFKWIRAMRYVLVTHSVAYHRLLRATRTKDRKKTLRVHIHTNNIHLVLFFHSFCFHLLWPSPPTLHHFLLVCSICSHSKGYVVCLFSLFDGINISVNGFFFLWSVLLNTDLVALFRYRFDFWSLFIPFLAFSIISIILLWLQFHKKALNRPNAFTYFSKSDSMSVCLMLGFMFHTFLLFTMMKT